MNRSLFSAACAACVFVAAVAGCQQQSTVQTPEIPMSIHKDGPPRKVVIGTCCHAMYGKFPGLAARCDELSGLIDKMAAQAKDKYGRGLDLVVLSEFSLNDMSQPLAKHAIPLDSPGFAYFQKKAKDHAHVPDPAVGRIRRQGVRQRGLPDRPRGQDRRPLRQGPPLPDAPPAKTFEGGTTPGKVYPVFDCDFGKIGIQICFDYMHAEGWRTLAAKGAELIVHPSQSPSVSTNAARAVTNRVYVVSSTWRDNATMSDPLGMPVAQIKPPQEILVHQIDLEYRLLPWDGKLRTARPCGEVRQGRGLPLLPQRGYGRLLVEQPRHPHRLDGPLAGHLDARRVRRPRADDAQGTGV